MRSMLVFPILLTACATDSSDLIGSDSNRHQYTPVGHAAVFRVDCTDDVCESVVAVPLELPEGAPASWNLDGETIPIEEGESLELSLESGEVADLTLEVEYEGRLWTEQQVIARSDVVDVEGTPVSAGYHIIGGANPIHPNVVTFGDCEDRKVKVSIIGGCFQSGQPFEVFLTHPGAQRPSHVSQYGNNPAKYDHNPLYVDLGDEWIGARVVLNQQVAFTKQATWPLLSNGNRLELAATASPLTRFLMIRSGSMVHEDAVEVRCEDNKFAVALSHLDGDKRHWVGP